MQILRFNRETKFTKTVQKLSKIHRQTKGGRSHHRLLNTPLVLTTCKIENTRSKSSTCLQKYDNARCLTCATSCWTAESTESRTRRKPLRAQALPGRKFPWTKVFLVRKSVLHTTQRQNDYHWSTYRWEHFDRMRSFKVMAFLVWARPFFVLKCLALVLDQPTVSHLFRYDYEIPLGLTLLLSQSL